MSNIEDFFGAGIQEGDYLPTERTKEMVPADGRNIFGFGFSKLESIMSLKEKIVNIDSINNSGLSRALCITALGDVGYRGLDNTGTIERINFNTGEIIAVDTGSTATSGYYDGCCSDSGDKIFFVGSNVSADDLFVVTSIDGGNTWIDHTVFTSGFTAIGSPNSDLIPQLVQIQCDKDGNKLRISVTAFDSHDFTLFFESVDSAIIWSEILTPRQILTNPNTNIGRGSLSRDLSTSIVFTNVSNQFYISVNGTGALVEKSAKLPELINDSNVALSDDGNKIVLFKSEKGLSDRIIFFSSDDDAETWLTHNVRLDVSNSLTNSLTTVKTIFFDPNDNNIIYLYVVVELTPTSINTLENTIFKYNINTFVFEKMGVFRKGDLIGDNNPSNFPFSSHNRSDFKSNNTGFILAIDDSQGLDKTFKLNLVEGKYLLDSSADTQPLKIFAGKQTQGLGFAWNKLTSVSVNDLEDTNISFDKTIILMSGFAGSIIRSSDSGATFATVTSGFNSGFTVFRVNGNDAATLSFASSVGQIRRSIDGGINWIASAGFSRTTISSDTDNNYFSLSCIADGTTIIAGALGGELDRSTDSGANFTLLSTPFSASTNTKLRSSVIARGDNQIIFVGNEGGKIKRSINGGTSFVDPTTPPVVTTNTKVLDIDCSSNGAIVIAAINDKLFLSTDTGDTWVKVAVGFSSKFYRAVTTDNAGLNIMITNGDGLLVRSIDSGVNFFKTDIPWFEESRTAKGIKLSTDGLLAYCATDNGLIYRTT